MKESDLDNLAGKVAGLLGTPRSDLAAIKADLEQINSRLALIENSKDPSDIRFKQNFPHPSSQRFTIADAVIDRASKGSNEKACAFEPNDRPCDHCSMCTARGF
ncbi:MAG: hypothetical protein ABI539_05595 [Acidobacteriota bacterium]